MRIAITSQGLDLDSEVDPRFGRCSQFVVVETDAMTFDVVENKQVLDLPQGAGIQSAQNLIPSKPAALLTGNCGPKAFKTLEAAGISVVVGVKGGVRDAVRDYMEGKFTPSDEANVEGHWV